jgi:hypothetical protein
VGSAVCNAGAAAACAAASASGIFFFLGRVGVCREWIEGSAVNERNVDIAQGCQESTADELLARERDRNLLFSNKVISGYGGGSAEHAAQKNELRAGAQVLEHVRTLGSSAQKIDNDWRGRTQAAHPKPNP